VQSSSSGVVSAAADLRVRLLWLTLFRTITTTLILGVLAAQLSSAGVRAELSTADLTSFAIIAFSYVMTLGTGLMLRTNRVGTRAAWTQIIVDVLLASSVVFLTGGARSPFTFLFLVTIVGAAVLLGTRGAVAGFIGAATAYGLVLASLLANQPAEAVPRLGLDVLIQLVAQLLIAVLSGYVGEQLSRTGWRLRASERDLQELTELQNEIVSAMPSGLVTCGSAGIVSFVNPAAESILGIVTSEVMGKREIDSVLPGVRELIVARRSELLVKTPRGTLILGLSLTPLSHMGGLLIVFQDLTELRRVERELGEIDHLATLGRLSAQLAHEIRNPLSAMRGSAQMLVGDSAGAPGERLAKLILRESDRLAELVEGYLKLARPLPPQLVLTRLDGVVRETLELLRADPVFAGVPVEEQLGPIEALCDAGQVKQVLINLLRNAAQAISQATHGARGRIRIRVSSGPESDGAVLEVWDSAGTLAPEDRARIFEPFFTRSLGGTGLGLSTVHSIVHAHGGTVAVTSSPATGTTFSVKFVTAQGTHGAHSGR
jgi:two-component system, NtrC family, sensor histidine kinase PilS